MHGKWIKKYPDGSVDAGNYQDGLRHGKWIEKYSNDFVYEGNYQDD